VLDTLYEGKDIGWEFGYATETSDRSSPMYTFPYRKTALQHGVDKLQSLIERLEVAVGESPGAIAIESLYLRFARSVVTSMRGAITQKQSRRVLS